MAFDICFQNKTLQYMPCAARFFREYDIPSVKSHLSLHKVASFCTVPLDKGVPHLFEINESKVMFKETAVQRYFKEVKGLYGRRTTMCQNGIL